MGTTSLMKDPQGSMLKELTRELFQTETSAAWHCRREGDRLGNAPPGQTLMEASRHAEEVLRELPPLMEKLGLPNSRAGRVVGRLFSETRQRVADRFITRERSYRGTLLGMRHGVGVVMLLAELARTSQNQDLVQFCQRWLAVRVPLMERAERELRWFAEHPLAGMRHAYNPLSREGQAWPTPG